MSLAGSPVSAECMAWCIENVKPDLWVSPGSGGTEVCTGFVGGVATLPVHAGEIQARALGCAAYAFNERGERVVNEVGELVITEPMPSMPLYFWRDPGHKRYLRVLFRHVSRRVAPRRFVPRQPARHVPGARPLGRHAQSPGRAHRHCGDLSRAGAVDEVDDGLIVNLLLPRGRILHAAVRRAADGRAARRARSEAKIRAQLRDECSPRHVPDRIYQVDAIPYTRSGKKLEVPVRHILMGMPPREGGGRFGAGRAGLARLVRKIRPAAQRLLAASPGLKAGKADYLKLCFSVTAHVRGEAGPEARRARAQGLVEHRIVVELVGDVGDLERTPPTSCLPRAM